MYTPPQNAAYQVRVRYSTFLARRLRRAGLSDLAATVKTATQKQLDLGRAWEDRGFDVQDALADREAADEALDEVAKGIWFTLSKRERDSVKKPPFTLIFPEGSPYYSEAPLDQQLPRYNLLIDRLKTNLPEDDEVRVTGIPKLQEALASYSEAVSGLDAARNTEQQARDQLEVAVADWKTLMEQVYGQLVSQSGKEKAEKYFPRARSKE